MESKPFWNWSRRFGRSWQKMLNFEFRQMWSLNRFDLEWQSVLALDQMLPWNETRVWFMPDWLDLAKKVGNLGSDFSWKWWGIVCRTICRYGWTWCQLFSSVWGFIGKILAWLSVLLRKTWLVADAWTKRRNSLLSYQFTGRFCGRRFDMCFWNCFGSSGTTQIRKRSSYR